MRFLSPSSLHLGQYFLFKGDHYRVVNVEEYTKVRDETSSHLGVYEVAPIEIPRGETYMIVREGRA